MNKKIILIIVAIVLALVIIAGAVWYFFWINNKKVDDSFRAYGADLEKIAGDATKGTLPSIEINPLENKPDLNPAEKANPIKDIKLNPFE